jgi:pyruvate kinase
MNSAEIRSSGDTSSSTGCDDLAKLIAQLDEICRELADVEHQQSRSLDGLPATQRASALNLLHYMQLRRRELRPLQTSLAALGLSSLGRSEAHVLDTIRAVLRVLRQLCGTGKLGSLAKVTAPNTPRNLLERHTEVLLGPRPADRKVRIMVTMPSEAAEDGNLIYELLQCGMDCMRINCAHDDATAWAQMIANLRRAEGQLGRRCRVLMDLAGPKLRTGPLAPGPQVVKWHPERDCLGSVLGPARIWLTPQEEHCVPDMSADAVLPLEGRWLSLLAPGHRLRLRDARGKKRELTITQIVGTSRWAESSETAYVTNGTALEAASEHAPLDWPADPAPCVGKLPSVEQYILLREGDRLVVTVDPSPGRPALRDLEGRIVQPAVISCSLAEAFPFVNAGEHIWFDDGHIGGIVRHSDDERLLVEITRAQPNGSKLRADKGINLPDSHLRLPALTAKDRVDLDFVAQHADLVGYSFVHTVDDVTKLQQLLAERRSDPPGIVLKIEMRSAFEHLPALLLAAMRSPVAGVMIARGDLGVECGFERLAEVQEEILWICEAAHMPVIWATQVLESLAKSGMPSRAEVTDAAMGARAECVMLNKGPYIVETLQTLDDILQRMEGHQSKKSPTLRPLGVARTFAEDP